MSKIVGKNIIVSGTGTSINVDTGGQVNIANNADLPGKAVQEQNNNIVVSNTNAATNSLAIVRGGVQSGGGLVAGEGFTATNPSAGTYVITFTTPFLDPPVIACVPFGGGSPTDMRCMPWFITNSAFEVTVYNAAGTPTTFDIFFIAIGQRS